MTLFISELFEKIDKAKTRQAKKDILIEQQDNHIFKYVLQGTYDPNVIWNTPKKFPKYVPDIAPLGLNEISLFTIMPKVSIFVDGHVKAKGLTEKKIGELLIQMLESLCKEEALIFEQMLKKKLKVKGLTEKLVLEVFPNLYRKV